MPFMSDTLFQKVANALDAAGETELLCELQAERASVNEFLRTGEVTALLGVSSINTVKNWLKGGHFPGAVQTPGGHWRFPRDEVEAVAARMQTLERQNAEGDLSPPDSSESPEPPLL